MRHGLPLDQFSFRLGGASSGLHILAAGRFVPKKGFDVLLDAAAQPELAERDFSMTLLGDGPGRRALASRIARLKLRNKVRIHEPAGGDALASIFDDTALFVAPYRTAPDGDADGVPNVVLEAFARGIPVVGTDAGSLPEILIPDTGTIVPQDDPAALAQAIAAVSSSPELGFNKSRNARMLVEQDYDIQKNIEPLWELVSC
jgi:glycosyltransferase involved in cell wall biosynthesis